MNSVPCRLSALEVSVPIPADARDPYMRALFFFAAFLAGPAGIALTWSLTTGDEPVSPWTWLLAAWILGGALFCLWRWWHLRPEVPTWTRGAIERSVRAALPRGGLQHGRGARVVPDDAGLQSISVRGWPDPAAVGLRAGHPGGTHQSRRAIEKDAQHGSNQLITPNRALSDRTRRGLPSRRRRLPPGRRERAAQPRCQGNGQRRHPGPPGQPQPMADQPNTQRASTPCPGRP